MGSLLFQWNPDPNAVTRFWLDRYSSWSPGCLQFWQSKTNQSSPRRPKSYHKRRTISVQSYRWANVVPDIFVQVLQEKHAVFLSSYEGNCAVNPRFLIVRIISISVNLSHIFLILIWSIKIIKEQKHCELYIIVILSHWSGSLDSKKNWAWNETYSPFKLTHQWYRIHWETNILIWAFFLIDRFVVFLC